MENSDHENDKAWKINSVPILGHFLDHRGVYEVPVGLHPKQWLWVMMVFGDGVRISEMPFRGISAALKGLESRERQNPKLKHIMSDDQIPVRRSLWRNIPIR